MVHALYGLMHCVRGVGHYDEQAPIDPADRSTWHRSGALDERDRMCWNDQFHGAASHSRTAAKPDPSCPVCGPTDLERHPRRTDVERCSNCKEWLRILDVFQ
ncbi:hypothetical protein ACIBCC_30010 [Streptomyces griseus]|uniref:hypothetical protein n=1 Tax=Streptomyces griseus TaxID=1911 RepID=UPI00379D351B